MFQGFIMPRSPRPSEGGGPGNSPRARNGLDALTPPKAGEMHEEAISSPLIRIPSKFSSPYFSSTAAPAATVAPGSTVEFETDDELLRRFAKGELPEEQGALNRVTGPVAVEGALPGDVLEISILSIDINSAWCLHISSDGPFRGISSKDEAEPLPIKDGRIQLSERLSVPLDPMIGCIGLAPRAGRSSAFEPAYRWGGNMDLRELSPGARLYLPVQRPGALLSVGDLHAAMGQGEPAWVGIEASGTATVRLDLHKDMQLTRPRIRAADKVMFLGIAQSPGTLERAVEVCTNDARKYLVEECKLEPREAFRYASACLELRFGGPATPCVLAVLPDPCPEKHMDD